MNTLIRSIIYTSLLFLSTINITQADGGGSGGGGGFPSQSAPSIDPVEKYQEGLRHLKNKDYKKAQKAFKKVLSVARKDANTHFYLGVSYFAQELAVNPKWFKNYKEGDFCDVIKIGKGIVIESMSSIIYWKKQMKISDVVKRKVSRKEFNFQIDKNSIEIMFLQAAS